jgi:hypothetical protein
MKRFLILALMVAGSARAAELSPEQLAEIDQRVARCAAVARLHDAWFDAYYSRADKKLYWVAANQFSVFAFNKCMNGPSS